MDWKRQQFQCIRQGVEALLSGSSEARSSCPWILLSESSASWEVQVGSLSACFSLDETYSDALTCLMSAIFDRVCARGSS